MFSQAKAKLLLILVGLCLSLPQPSIQASKVEFKHLKCYHCEEGDDDCLYENPPTNVTCDTASDGCVTIHLLGTRRGVKRCLCYREWECLKMIGVELTTDGCQTWEKVEWPKVQHCLRNPKIQRYHDIVPTKEEKMSFGPEQGKKSGPMPEILYNFCYCKEDFCNSNSTIPYQMAGGRRRKEPVIAILTMMILLIYSY